MRCPRVRLPTMLILVGGLLTGCGGGEQERPSPAATALGAARAGRPIQVGRAPVAVAIGSGAVWVADQAQDAVTRIDPRRRNTVGRPIPAGRGPFALAVGDGAVWVADGDGQIRSIDPRTSRLRGGAVRIVGANGLAVGAGGVWVTSRIAGTVTRIDPRTRRADPPIHVGAGPADVSVGFGAVWVANAADGTVSRIDPSTRSADPPIAVGASSLLALTAGEGAIWLARAGGDFQERIEVVRLDPQTRKIAGRPIAVSGAVPFDLAAGDGSIWATDVGGFRAPGPARPGSVMRIDPRGPTRAGRPFRVGERPAAVAAGAGGAWIANAGDETVTPILVQR